MRVASSLRIINLLEGTPVLHAPKKWFKNGKKKHKKKRHQVHTLAISKIPGLPPKTAYELSFSGKIKLQENTFSSSSASEGRSCLTSVKYLFLQYTLSALTGNVRGRLVD
jgi:hypothetical protein